MTATDIIDQFICRGPCLCLRCHGFPGFTEVLGEFHAGVGLLGPGQTELSKLVDEYPSLKGLVRRPPTVTHLRVHINGHDAASSPPGGLGLRITEVWCSKPTAGLDGADPLSNDGWIRGFTLHGGDRSMRKCRKCGEAWCETLVRGSVTLSGGRSMERALGDLTRAGSHPTRVVH